MDATFVNIAIVVVYLVAMLAFGWWGKSRTKNNSDFLVAGRRLGPFLYTGTMAAVVLGGASTVGGVGLGYKFGISGMWLVVAIGVGVLLLSLLFAGTIQKLKIYTVSQMLTLRYGSRATQTSGIVMLAYTLMLCATSTGAYATIFVVLFGWDRALAIAIGGAIVLVYSTIGGMWSITLADQVQFVIKTVGIFVLMLPFTLNAAGGFDGIRARVDASFFQIDGIGDPDHHHLLRRLHPRPADRPGHLAARLHRQDPDGCPLGRRHRRHLLHPLRCSGRPDRPRRPRRAAEHRRRPSARTLSTPRSPRSSCRSASAASCSPPPSPP